MPSKLNPMLPPELIRTVLKPKTTKNKGHSPRIIFSIHPNMLSEVDRLVKKKRKLTRSSFCIEAIAEKIVRENDVEREKLAKLINKGH